MAEAHFLSYEKYSDSSTWTAIVGTTEYLVFCRGKGSARAVENFVDAMEGSGAPLDGIILGYQRMIHHG